MNTKKNAPLAKSVPPVRSLLSRKLEILYLAFFIIHIPVIFAIDSFSLHPKAFQLPLLANLQAYYMTTYRDRLFINPPTWFQSFIWLELIYHVPLSIWAVGAIWKDHPLVPLHLLVFALEAGITTWTCIADILGWEDFPRADMLNLMWLYVPYLILAIIMGIDMFWRLKNQLAPGIRKERAS